MKTKGAVLESRVYNTSVTPPASMEDCSRFENNGVFTAISNFRLPSGLCVREFNGTTSLIDCGSGDSLASYIHPAFSMEAWVYADNDGQFDEGRIFSKATGYELWIDSETGAGCLIECTIDHATDANAITSDRLTVATWHYVAMVYNRLGTNHAEIYLDGALCTLGTDTAGVGVRTDDTATTLYIGNNAATNRTFDGKMVYWRIYSYALTAADIYAHYQDKRGWFGV